MVLTYIRLFFAYANSDQNGEGCQGVGCPACPAGSSSRRQPQLPVGRPFVQNRRKIWSTSYSLRYDCSRMLLGVGSGDSMETLIQDVRYGLRMLRKSPGLTAVAVLTLALGIGADSTIFSWIHGTLLNPIPGVSHASQVVELTGLSYPDYVDLRDRNHSFFALVAVDL